jgi:LmbE family N-acetylglucosaminyl deacetylase
MTEPHPNPRSALAVMAHPDDIEFMAGGLFARWARAGVELHYCLLTDGASGSRDPNLAPHALAALRRDEQRAAGALFGVRSYSFLGYPDGRLIDTIELRLAIAGVIRQVRPEAVLTSDPRFYYRSTYVNHPDHRAAGEATLAAVMPLANTRLAAPELLAEGLEPHDVQSVYLATPSEPGLYIPLSEQDLADKTAAMRAHASQVSQFPGFAELLRSFAEQAGKQARDQGIACALAEAYVFIGLRRQPAQQPS